MGQKQMQRGSKLNYKSTHQENDNSGYSVQVQKHSKELTPSLFFLVKRWQAKWQKMLYETTNFKEILKNTCKN